MQWINWKIHTFQVQNLNIRLESNIFAFKTPRRLCHIWPVINQTADRTLVWIYVQFSRHYLFRRYTRQLFHRRGAARRRHFLWIAADPFSRISLDLCSSGMLNGKSGEDLPLWYMTKRSGFTHYTRRYNIRCHDPSHNKL